MQGLEAIGISLESIIVYLAGYGVLFTILFKLLYKPLNHYLEERQVSIKRNLEEADRIKSEFQAKFEAIKAEKDRVHSDLSQQLKNAEELVEKKRLELLSEMETKRQDLLNKTQAEIEETKSKLISDVEARLSDVITKIILEVTYNKVPKDIIEESVKQSWNEYKSQI